jgi:hypothetical protein
VLLNQFGIILSVPFSIAGSLCLVSSRVLWLYSFCSFGFLRDGCCGEMQEEYPLVSSWVKLA